MNGPTRRLALVVFTGFGILLLASSWFQVLGADRYRADPRNVRNTITLVEKERGLIVAADGTVLARSDPVPDTPQAYARTYPEGSLYAHTVGYSTFLVGETGLEATYAARLRSRQDLTISDLLAALFGRDLRPENLQTTLQPIIQRAAYEALGNQRGAVVALDPRSGAILGYVTTPSFDPNSLLGSDAVPVRQGLLDDPSEPLLDRVGRALYPPGSSFKTVVAAAGIEAGVAGPETEFDDVVVFDLPGSTADISNAGGGTCAGGGTVTLQMAFVRSCNTVFADLAIRVGARTIDTVTSALGFGRRLNFPWEIAISRFPADELQDDPAALGQSGLGERDVRATPLAMAMVAAAVANEGDVMQPRIVDQVFDIDGRTTTSYSPQRLGRAMSPATAAVIAQMMERTVTDGTGTRAAVPGFRVAGKTGTAQGADGPQVWFIGFAPVEDPVIALAVLVEDGGNAGDSGTGGSVAAPIAARVLSAWLTGGT
ncbi:MAG TPA: penicillin-binding transpeptidase domain-containing protein [Acidimicrobiia bacterium]|nr:penicillin-binding transpeptidase domain-containing protein [Acidimicrobiia bacterium]